jgi:hypothetical protein
VEVIVCPFSELTDVPSAIGSPTMDVPLKIRRRSPGPPATFHWVNLTEVNGPEPAAPDGQMVTVIASLFA